MESTNSASKVTRKIHLVRNSILQPVTLAHRFTREHGLMNGLSFSDMPIDSRRRGGGGGGVGWNLYGARVFFQKFLDKPMEERVVWECEYFFRKFHSPSESQLLCPLYSRAKE